MENGVWCNTPSMFMCHFAVPKALIKSPYGFQSCFLSLDLWGQIIFYSPKSFLNYVWQFLVKNLSENEESLRMRFTGFVSCTRCSLHSLHKAEDRECPGNGIQLCFVLLSCQLVWRYLLQQRTQKRKGVERATDGFSFYLGQFRRRKKSSLKLIHQQEIFHFLHCR